MSNGTRTLCPFCSMGCSLRIRRGTGAAYQGDEEINALDYDPEGPVGRGSLCAKGNMTLELLEHPRRLETPTVRSNGAPRPASWEEAVEEVVRRLARIREAAGAQAIGVLVGPHLTNEEASIATRIVRSIGTPNVDVGMPEDRAVLAGIERSAACPPPVRSVGEIERMTATLIIGDLFTLSPCISKPLLNARYDRRRNLQGVLGPIVNRTDWFGKPSLRCRPGQEAAALALCLQLMLEPGDERRLTWYDSIQSVFERVEPDELERLSGLRSAEAVPFLQALRAEPESGIFFCTGFGASERVDLAAGLSALLAEATQSRYLAMVNGANAHGVWRVLGEEPLPRGHGMTAGEMLEAAVTGDLQALLVFGCDPIGAYPGPIPLQAAAKLRLLVATACLPSETTDAADVVLPAAAWGEKPGTVSPAFEQSLSLGVALPPPGAARPDHASLGDLARACEQASHGRRQESVRGAQRVRPAQAGFFDELAFFFRTERRARGEVVAGTHLLLPYLLPSHAGDGAWTRQLSWPGHEGARPLLSISPAHAERLGVAEGQPVLVRSRTGEMTLPVRIEARLPQRVVLAPPHFPEVRRLMRWRLDPALGDLDLQPSRVSVARLPEVDDAA